MRNLPRPAWAALLVLAVNAVVLLGVAANRRGQPDSIATLTERELPLAWEEKEDTGIALRLDWRDWEPAGAKPWFDVPLLEALGYRCSLPPDHEDAEMRYGKMLPRRGFGVFEYDGDAWSRYRAEQDKALAAMRLKLEQQKATADEIKWKEDEIAVEMMSGSRLFLVGAGPDAEELRRRHPDRARFLILPVVVRLSLRRDWDQAKNDSGPPYLAGSVSEVLIDQIHVPRRQRGIPDEVRDEDERRREAWTKAGKGYYGMTAREKARPPAYEVVLHHGRRLEPWIASIARLPASGGAPVSR